VSICDSPTCLPTLAKSTFQLTYHITVRSYRLYGHLPRQHCTDCTVSKILHVWKNEQNMISFSYDICLSLFKLHWVRNNEAYTHVHFEVIPRTFIFEKKLIPWITLNNLLHKLNWFNELLGMVISMIKVM
jgi:hypothetical protein